jgi:alpha-D-xyloside xylohydrolase
VIRGYRRLTGAAPLMPLWAFGYWQSKERYQSAKELESVVAEYRRRNIPLDVIVQDWCYWGDWSKKQYWSGMFVDEEQFGDLGGAIRRIHRQGAKVMISIWPTLGPATKICRELKKRGHMFDFDSWCGAFLYDAFAPAAREIYWRHVRDGLLKPLDVDAWWMDATEPEFAAEGSFDPVTNRLAALKQRDTAAGPWRRVLNAYGLVHTGGVYRGQRAATDRKRVLILTRSAFAGQQRHGAATWSGDIGASWHVFAEHIPAGLNFCAAGIPYWTTDCGAFFVEHRGGRFPEGVKDPAYRELYLRWFQYSTFCPIMRSHGTQTPREVWQFGQPGELIHDALVEFVRLRTRLVPYLYSVAATSTTPMRALAFDWPNDRRAANVPDQFMCGPALMVAPMTQPVAHVAALPECVLYSDLADEHGESMGITVRRRDGRKVVTDREGTLDVKWREDCPHLVELNGTISPPARATGLHFQTTRAIKVWLADKLVLDVKPGTHVVKHKFATRVPVRLRLTCAEQPGTGKVYVGWRGLGDHVVPA